MASSQNGIPPMLREWAPLTELFSKLPAKTQTGIFFQDIKLTCVDVLPEFLALGTNVGVVYWYDRKKRDMQRLRCETNIPITALKVISTVDYMIACGNRSGNISIFQIPKSHPESIPESLKPQNKQVERYTVMELHKAPISAMEWSKNGMKLFSGDKNGCIVLTEIDFYMHICKSMEILNESYEVVQLSYNQQRLLVSTTYRSIICEKKDKWIVCQVGKKDRKVLGSYGGIICQNSYKPSDTCLYCSRPGLRIWISDVEGNVQKTLLFKELLTKECSEVPIINPIAHNLHYFKPQREPAFGILLPFNEKLLVTYNNDVVYILDPQEMTVLSTISHLRSVLNVATHKDEIFVLEEDRSLIRVSYKPEHFITSASSSATFSSMNDSTFLPLSTSLKDLTTKLQSSNIISAIPPILEHAFTYEVNVHTDENMVVKAEEARESPVRTRTYNPDIQKKFDEIGKKDFEDKILFKKSKHRKKRSSMDNSTISLSSNSSDEKDLSYTRPTIMNLSAVGVLPDLRSPESIKNDIEYKEKILADILSLDKVKINEENSVMSPLSNSQPDCDNYLGKNDIESEEFGDHVEKITPLKRSKPIPVKKNSFFESSIGMKTSGYTPDCISIPKEWKLSNIELNKRPVSVSSDNSSDWELV
ncbi:unnamed protein product [Phaedon cochleariae]|uniref:HPS5-like beta-propeller domain-containing protein n=1 Tax=Phaedon cochleariae TaxID=80249 RepID=A0A9N9SFI8_PHACE|nr:unnamed protein product [Phaedon cochleariae]